MGLLSIFKSKPATIPSLEEQEKNARNIVDNFIGVVYSEFDKTEDSKERLVRKKFKIAGITNYCTVADQGLIKGVAFIDKNNQFDKNAIGLGKLNKNNAIASIYGYIPKDSKEDYEKIAEGKPILPFIGYIRRFTTYEGKSGLMGQVKFYSGPSKKIYEEMVKDVMTIDGAFKGYDGDQRISLEEQEYVLKGI